MVYVYINPQDVQGLMAQIHLKAKQVTRVLPQIVSGIGVAEKTESRPRIQVAVPVSSLP